MTELWTAIEPAVLELLALVLTIAIAFAAAQLRAWTGIEIAAKHREALHEAVMSGVLSASKHGMATGTETFRAHVLAHVRASVPDALAYLDPLPDVLQNIVERKAREALAKIGEPK